MLTTAQQERTSTELHTALARSGLTRAQVAADLDLNAQQLDAALSVVDAHDPMLVWLVRDHLARAVHDAVGEPFAFTVLTDDARHQASTWFPLREAPPPTPATGG